MELKEEIQKIDKLLTMAEARLEKKIDAVTADLAATGLIVSPVMG